MGRQFFIGGNWKSNGTLKSNEQLVNQLNDVDIPTQTEVVIAPTFLHIPQVTQLNKNSRIAVSAQNCGAYKQGAHTGEVSADQLTDFGLKWVILGHSERRQEAGESDEVVAKKVKIALENKLSVIACVGETLEQRESKKQVEVVTRQLDALKSSVSDWNQVVIAYEPVWAIGTGKNASAEQAQEMHSAIRQWLGKAVDDKTAQSVRVLYGGSVKGSNAAELIAQKDIDGFLVGGASLKFDDFKQIIESTKSEKAKSKL